MRVSNTPDYGAGVNGWRKLLVEQANDLVMEGETELYPWLVEQAWEVKRAGLLVGPLPELLGTGDPEGKFQDTAQGGGGNESLSSSLLSSTLRSCCCPWARGPALTW